MNDLVNSLPSSVRTMQPSFMPNDEHQQEQQQNQEQQEPPELVVSFTNTSTSTVYPQPITQNDHSQYVYPPIPPGWRVMMLKDHMAAAAANGGPKQHTVHRGLVVSPSLMATTTDQLLGHLHPSMAATAAAAMIHQQQQQPPPPKKRRYTKKGTLHTPVQNQRPKPVLVPNPGLSPTLPLLPKQAPNTCTTTTATTTTITSNTNNDMNTNTNSWMSRSNVGMVPTQQQQQQPASAPAGDKPEPTPLPASTTCPNNNKNTTATTTTSNSKETQSPSQEQQITLSIPKSFQYGTALTKAPTSVSYTNIARVQSHPHPLLIPGGDPEGDPPLPVLSPVADDTLLQLHPVQNPQDLDILLGSGMVTNNHCGNRLFRRLIAAYRPTYRELPRRSGSKRKMAHNLHNFVRLQGARFLVAHKTDASTNSADSTGSSVCYFDCGSKRAEEKVFQALREITRESSSKQSEES